MRNLYLILTTIAVSLLSSNVMAQYCSPSPDAQWENITSVKLNNGLVNINNTSGPKGAGAAGYVDYTIANQHYYKCTPGTNVAYNVGVEGDWNGGGSVTIWIDWSQNNAFETGEKVAFNNGWNTSNSGTFAVPSTYQGNDIPGKTYRMRIRSTDANSHVTNPCTGGRGEVEDYNFSVLYNENAALQEMLDPFVPSCAIGDSVIISLLNNSDTDLDSVTINWSKNDTMQTPYEWHGNLTANDPAEALNIGALNYKYGDTIKVWLSLVNGDTLDDNQGDDTLMRVPRPGLKGTYTVGGAGSDYDSLHKAMRDIHEIGVCGNVIFNLNNGKHYALCDFTEIPGITNNAEITFNSTSMDADSAFINWSSRTSATNRVLGFYGTQNITFNNITIEDTSGSSYSRLVTFDGSHNITFNNCVFDVTYNGTSSNAGITHQEGFAACQDITFDGCDFYGGYEGVYFNAPGNSTNEGIVITDCSFNDHYYRAVRMFDVEDFEFTYNSNSNVTRIPSSSSTMLYLDNVSGDVEIHDNDNITTERSMRYGFRILNTNGTPSNPIALYNNRLIMGDSTLSWAYEGIRIENTKFYQITNNAIQVLGTSGSAYAVIVNGGAANEITNNILANYGSGDVFNITSNSSVSLMENNVLHGVNDIGRLGNQTVADLAAWQNNYGYDINSIDVDPMFVDSTLRTCNVAIDNIGMAGMMSEDVSGVLRSSSTPDPGAFEFSAPAKFSVGDAYNICNGDTLVLEAEVSAADVIVWNGMDTSKTMWFTNTGTYYSELIGECGNAIDTFMVNINKVVELPNDTNLCAGEMLSASADLPNAQYAWNNGAQTQAITISKRGQYFVEVIDTNGCWSSDTIEVTVSTAAHLPNDTTICEGNTVALNPGTGAGTYVWSNGSSSSLQFVDSSSTYWVQFTDPLNCVSSDTTRVVVEKLPFATFSQSNFSQSNWEFTADDKNGVNYEWSFGDGKVDTGLIWKTVNIYDTNGTFKVTLIVTSKSCGTATFSKDIAVETIGTAEQLVNNNGINVFPNPTVGMLNISVPNALLGEKVVVSLVDLSGKVILEENVSSFQNTQLDLKEYNMSTGVYQLTITGENNRLYNGKITLH